LRLALVDYGIIGAYFAAVLGIGFALKRRMRASLDFLLAGRAIPAWAAGLAFIAANLGAQEVIGMAASGAKYGWLTSHFYWLGAIPAMAFVAVFMMPFYYGSRARSVPEYLRLRFDEKTRTLNALSFAAMTILSSSISMFAMAKLFNLFLGWNMHASIVLSALVVLGYIVLGGLTSEGGDVAGHAIRCHFTGTDRARAHTPSGAGIRAAAAGAPRRQRGSVGRIPNQAPWCRATPSNRTAVAYPAGWPTGRAGCMRLPNRLSLNRRIVSGPTRRPSGVSKESASCGHCTRHAPQRMQRSACAVVTL